MKNLYRSCLCAGSRSSSKQRFHSVAAVPTNFPPVNFFDLKRASISGADCPLSKGCIATMRIEVESPGVCL